jgi:hypothetical protein
MTRASAHASSRDHRRLRWCSPLLLVTLLSMKGVGELFFERATLTQSYDTGELGRFGRYVLGIQLLLDTPVGPRAVSVREDLSRRPPQRLSQRLHDRRLARRHHVHSLSSSMTLWLGLTGALRATPWRPVMLAVWATFVAVAGEGAIIDTDHWRHFWLLAGVLWGGAIAASRSSPRFRAKSARKTC